MICLDRVQMAEDLSFSRIVHGLWRLADWKFSDEELIALIEQCIEQGITTFDHADIYGSYTCESLFGRALEIKPGLRRKMEIVTKCGIVLESPNRPEHKSHHYNTGKEHIIASVEKSLQNLKTDYIDTLLIHRPDPFMDPEEVADAFATLKNDGKVRHFGVSNFKSHHFTMLQSYLEMDLITNQIELSAFQLENFEDGTLNLCLEKRIAPMAWSPLAGGKIFSSTEEKPERLRTVLLKVAEEIGAQDIDEVLFAWLLNHPARIMPITGSGRIERIERAVRSLSYKLNRDQWFEIYQTSLGHDVP